MKVLVTGSAGFIGYHVARSLIERGDSVVGFDVIDDYYDPALKHARLAQLDAVGRPQGGDYSFIQADLANQMSVDAAFAEHNFDRVIHLAAQAGVRYSLENPRAYVASNLVGFTNILEACRHNRVPHLTYASTSSVYGANTKLPFSEHDSADHPLQFYAATKRANELMAHSYSHLFGLPTTGLRFFTVYGPWGRPDMALFKFTRSILGGEPIDLYNHGNHTRDYTYIDDIVEGVIRASDRPATADPTWDSATPQPANSNVPFQVFNIGNSVPVKLIDFVASIELALGKEAVKNFLPLQPGDVLDTFSDTRKLVSTVGYKPSTAVEAGVKKFVDWYLTYYARHASGKSE